ncbi:hypothetical protein N2152v2_001017 [Parachlorella kessleri]
MTIVAVIVGLLLAISATLASDVPRIHSAETSGSHVAVTRGSVSRLPARALFQAFWEGDSAFLDCCCPAEVHTVPPTDANLQPPPVIQPPASSQPLPALPLAPTLRPHPSPAQPAHLQPVTCAPAAAPFPSSKLFSQPGGAADASI